MLAQWKDTPEVALIIHARYAKNKVAIAHMV